MKRMSKSLKHFGFGFFSVLVLMLMTSSFANAQNGLKEFFELLEKGEKQKAVESIKKSISEQPAANNLLYYLGYGQIQLGELDNANKSFDQGLAKNDKEAIMYAGKGNVLVLQKKPAEAKLAFDKALSLSKSKNVEVLQAIARGQMADPSGLKDAIATLEKAKSLKPENTFTYYMLGDAYLAQKNGGSAVGSYEWAATYEPNSGKGHYKAGMVYLRTKDFKVAEESFKKSIAADPNFAPSYDELAELAYNNGQGAEAQKYWDKYMQLTGNKDEDKARKAFYCLMVKDFNCANTIFDELRKKGIVTVTTLRYNGYALFEEGKYPESVTVFDQYFAKADTALTKPADYTYYGNALIKASPNPQDSLNVDKGIESLKKSLKKEPKQPQLVKQIADLLYKRKKYADAIVYYKLYMPNAPGSKSNEYYSIGRAYYFNKQYQQADTAFTKLVELQATQPAGHLWLSRTKAQLEEIQKTPGSAKPYYEKLIEVSTPTADKNKNELIEANLYLASYYAITKDDMSQAKNYMNKVLALDPKNATALNFFNELKKAEQKK